MIILKCKMCGGDVQLSEDKTFGTCEFCGNTMTFPKVSDDQKAAFYNRGNHFRRMGEFDKALTVYEQIIRDDNTDAEAHWCCALSRFGIEYVEDPVTLEWIPTCHRASFDSFLDDVDYLAALEYSDGITKRQYQKDAMKIADVQKRILATSREEEPFDVFICYKESENDGSRTVDSTLAQDIYYQLTDAGFKTFFSRITLEDKTGAEFEPFIFAALNSAKVMVVVGTTKEHLDAVWVKNEWSRYLALMRKDRSKILLPCYRDMDPYDMPEALSVLQSYDMSKIGFIQDLIRGIKKVVAKEEKETKPVAEQVIIRETGSKTNALIDRGNMALEDGEWQKADEFFEEVLNQDAKCAEAYLGKLMAKCKKSNISSFTQYYVSINELAENEILEACPEDSQRIDSTVTKYVIDGYLAEGEIRKLYVFDRTYASQLSFRKQQKATVLSELAEEKLLVRARQYATGDAKATIDKILEDISAALDKRISDAESEDSHLIAMVKSSYEMHLNEADTKAQELYDKALNQQETDYNYRVSSMNAADSIDKLEKIRDLFENMNGYKDTKALAQKCQDKIDRIKEEERLEAERAEEARKKEFEKQARKKKKIKIISVMTVVACIALFFIFSVVSKNNTYNKAVNYMNAGDYKAAKDNFLLLKGYKDSNKYLNDIMKIEFAAANVGDTVTFGNYNGSTRWRVLAKENNKMLIISLNAIDEKPYNEAWEDITWEKCTLRDWLNSEYFETAFDTTEQAVILSSYVINSDNPEYGTDGGRDITDKVFLLSIYEVNKYFSSDSDRKTTLSDGTSVWWWLRSPGCSSGSAAYVNDDGSVFESGYNVSLGYGAVRPALWVDISNLD